MRTIWKYEINVGELLSSGDGSVTLQVPTGGKVIHCGRQHNQGMLWVEVDTTRGSRPRKFFVLGTGKYLSPYVGAHVGTFTLAEDGHELVFHVYQEA